MRKVNLIKNIYISEDCKESKIVQNILERKSPSVKIEFIKEAQEILQTFRKHGDLNNRENLLVYSHRGNFLSVCPGTDGMVCCQYFIINLGQGCLFDCHYCYLQGFVNNPLLTIFGNTDKLFQDLDTRTLNKNTHFRIGTGEYADSLGLEELTGQAAIMVDYFSRHPNATLELKTKSSNISGLLELDHRGHTVVAWSLNPMSIIQSIEEGTASLEERLKAAKEVAEVGYKLAFHLDPIIYMDDWENEYHNLIDMIFDYVNPDKVSWISIGSFRYTSGLKEVIQARFPDDTLTRNGEMLRGTDGKFRYYKDIRFNMFKSIKNKIESINPKLFMYLCMENKQSWQNVFGFVPSAPKILDHLFEQRREYVESVTKK